MNYSAMNLLILKGGTKEQPILQKKGDDLRIDWGYLYVAGSKNEGPRLEAQLEKTAIQTFTRQSLAEKQDTSTSGGHQNLLNYTLDPPVLL